jgi:hypothetical protein
MGVFLFVFLFSVSILHFLLILLRIWRLRDEWAGLTHLF